MTNQEKKEYLSQYQDVTREINRLSDEIDRWRSSSEKITPTYSLTPKGSSGTDKIQSAVEHIESYTEKLAEVMLKAIKLCSEIVSAINTVSDLTLQSLLKYRYIDNMTWEQIAVEMHYTYKWVCKLHGDALNQIQIST